MLLMIDNYDSFTYNLVQYFLELGVKVSVFRNDDIDIEAIKKLNPNYIVISPGPCTPNEAGISLAAIEAFKGNIPILGVCLGHQCIAQAFGATVIKADKVMHGKTSSIQHTHQGVFENINSPMTATRYHSLIVDKATLPNDFLMTAWTEDKNQNFEAIMAIKHKTLALEGIQFHPESILTEHGHVLLKNFLTQNRVNS